MKKMDFHFSSLLKKSIKSAIMFVFLFAFSTIGVINAQIPALLDSSSALPVLTAEIDRLQSKSNPTTLEATQIEYYTVIGESIQTGSTTERAIFDSFGHVYAAINGATAASGLPSSDEYYSVVSLGSTVQPVSPGSTSTESHIYIDTAVALLRQ